MRKILFNGILSLLTAIPITLFAQLTTTNPSVKVSGEVSKPLVLTKADLSKMSRTTVTLRDHDGKAVSYTGVKVQEILELAGVASGKQLRGKQLTKFLLIKCSDGYEVVFSLAELDKGFNDKLIILADKSMNTDLPHDKGSFRIVVPGEKAQARSSFKVTEMIVMSASK